MAKEKITQLVKKHPLKLIVSGILLGFLLSQFNFTGYCEAAGRVLSKDEIFQKVAGDIYANDPECCFITDTEFPYDKFSIFLDKLFGRYLIKVELIYKREANHELYPYYHKIVIIDQCGKSIDTLGMERSESMAQTLRNSFKKKENK